MNLVRHLVRKPLEQSSIRGFDETASQKNKRLQTDKTLHTKVPNGSIENKRSPSMLYEILENHENRSFNQSGLKALQGLNTAISVGIRQPLFAQVAGLQVTACHA